MTEQTNTTSVGVAPESKPLEGMKAALVVPSYGTSDPACAKDVRVGMMNAAAKGLAWVGDLSPDRMGYATARNTTAQEFIEEGEDFADGIVWIDNDIRFAKASISRLLYQARRLKADFISGVYHQRGGMHMPVFYLFDEKLNGFRNVDDYPADMIAPADGCGFGFVWTSKKLIDAIARHPEFDPRRGWFPDERSKKGGYGEDLSFCYQAMRCGIQLYVDTGIQVGHMGEPEIITREHFLKSKAERDSKKADSSQALVRGRREWGF